MAACAALAVATLATYWPVTSFPFVDWDDPVYVRDNPHVTTGLHVENFLWSWKIHGPGQWHPLTWWSHQLDCTLFGAGPESARGHHATNLALHIAAAVTLLLALKRLTGALGPSACVAALFALHPLSVESVAWIAERRDVLCALLFAATLLAYVSYARCPGAARYLLVAALFALGLMAKPMLVTVPGVLLLLDFWPLARVQARPVAVPEETAACPRRRVSSLVVEKLPLLLLSAVSAWLSYKCQQEMSAVVSTGAYPISSRIANATVSYVLYLRNMLWPWNLGPMYSLPSSIAAWKVFAAAAVLLLVTSVVVAARRRHPYLLVGWLWYLGMLLPVSGLLRMGSDVSMADRWVYLPLIGIYIAVVWGLRDVLAGMRGGKVAAVVLTGLVLAACIGLTRRQIYYWRNSEALFRRSIAVDPNMALAHFNLGKVLELKGENETAATHYSTAVRLNNNFAGARCNLGVVLQSLGRTEEAIEQFQAALQAPTDGFQDARFKALNNLAWIRATHPESRFRDGPQAVTLAQQAANMASDDPAVLDTLAAAYAEAGQFTEAVATAQRALQLASSSPERGLADGIRGHLQQFQAGVPHREKQK